VHISEFIQFTSLPKVESSL